MATKTASDLPHNHADPLTDGIYSLALAAQLTGLPAAKMRKWLSARGSKPSVVSPVYDRQMDRNWYISFLDMVELKLIGELRQAEVPMHTIRKAHRRGRELLGVSHPFASQELETDGKSVLIRYKGTLMDLDQAQYVLEDVIAPFLDSLSFDLESKLAKSWRIHDGVVVDPRHAMGKPVVEGSKVPTAILARAVEGADGNVETVAEWYEISIEDVQHAVDFESRLKAFAA